MDWLKKHPYMAVASVLLVWHWSQRKKEAQANQPNLFNMLLGNP